ncbi:hypothetical protein LBMAG56_30220 [Verrucomicrobiota bacterium]|nr:hypothetical protein LBMAG56_30220 [Verrucomicrobiota bacterium]
MRYYLQNPADRVVTGPFELDDIEAKLEAGELPADTLATGDIGESLGQVRRTPAEDWMPVKSIPGFGQERPRNLPPREASPPLPTLALPPPTELFPAHLWRKPQSPPEQIAFCPFCGQRAGGPVSLGETRCGQCGKVLYPATGTNRVPAPSRPVSLLMFIAGFIGGLVVQIFSLNIVGLFGLAASKSGRPALGIIFGILVCVGWIAIAIPLSRRPPYRGFAYGIALGVGVTALLTASCALSSVK